MGGRQYGELDALPALYRQILASVHRALRPGGRAALLTSEDNEAAVLAAAAAIRSPLDTADAARPSVRAVGSLRFRFGGHRDRQRCALCCFVRARDDGSLANDGGHFDWTLGRLLEEDPQLTWKDLKPSMVPYQPWRSSS